jgi:DNA-binding IclR family transcriptional regulator
MQPKLVQKMIERELRDPEVIAQTKTPVSQKTIEAKLNEVRSRNLARVQNEPIPGINAFSAPVFNHMRSMVLAITVSGPSGSFDSSWNGPIATQLKACADHLSHVLGHNPRSVK